jgi:4-hydroxy-2-oxoheptanedioate aldolase
MPLLDNSAARGGAAGVHLSFLCPEIVEFIGWLGFQWLFLDAEHTPLNHHLARDLIRAADSSGLASLVRVPRVEAAIIEGFLDAGASGIIAPAMESAAQVRELVSSVKFPPLGTRGAAFRTRAARFGLIHSTQEFCRQANSAIVTVALIESLAGVEHVEEIMAVPGLDYVGIGANDLGLSMGFEEGAAHPRAREVVAAVQERIRAYGKAEFLVVADATQVRGATRAASFTERGGLIAIPDSTLLRTAGQAFLNELRG